MIHRAEAAESFAGSGAAYPAGRSDDGRVRRAGSKRRLMPKHLVVTADDFGLAVEVNEAVERAHVDGILGAASLMVGAPAAADAIARARRLPGLRVGLHLALVEAQPLLPAETVRDLVGPDGWFRRDPAAYGTAIFFKPRLRRQVEAEIEAQFAAFADTGLVLDHVNAHQHFHLHPVIAAAMMRIGPRYGMRAVRLPAEPQHIIRAIEPAASGLLASITRPWTARLGRQLRAQGFRVPDAVFGLAWTGAMTADRIGAIIDRLPGGLSEIYTHPATDAGFRGAAPGYRYAEELAGLLDAGVKAAVQRSGASLGGFSDALA